MEKKAVILINLGSPNSTELKDVRRYLEEFLMDGRVIDMPYFRRLLLVKGIIVPFRVRNSAAAYKSIWWKEGSPLVVLSKQLEHAVQQNFEEPVEIAMRYGNPSPKTAYDKIMSEHPGIEEAIIFPLYPHYAMSSYETAVEYMKEVHKKNNYSFRLTIVPPYYNDPEYINALAESMRPYLNEGYDKILLSYHGIPERHIHKTDVTGNHCLKVANCCETNSPAHTLCYRHQTLLTTKLIAAKLDIQPEKYEISFQSRLGKGWLQPFTDVRLEELPKEGIKKLLVVCPAFVSDCLETLEEIAERGKESFLHAGGESFMMIPCMNTHPLWVKAITTIINRAL